MPLPDERPRQSVANLIGRFEKQKSSSGGAVAPAPPPAFMRTSSVASQRSADSAQEEIKEKREWPPKSVAAPTPSLSPSVQSPGKLQPPSLTPPLQREPSLPPEPILPSPPVEPKPSNNSPSPPTDKLSQSMSPKAKSPPPSETRPTTTRPASTVKSTTPKPTVRPSIGTPLKPTASSASSTPLKTQHTGQSVGSASPAARSTAKRVSAPKPAAAVTPARARTPLSAARSQTPSSTSRPKTPSSGLYAPTAASLARSKAGLPAPPSVEKPKRKITTDLSKPTAASASRVRTPAATPTRGGKTPAGKSSAARPVIKPAAGKVSTPARQPPTIKHPAEKPATEHSKTLDTTKGVSDVEHSTGRDVLNSSIEPAKTALTESGEMTPELTLSAVVTTATIVETDPENDIYEPEINEDEIAGGDEVHDAGEPHESHGEEEIESYDDDFLDDGLPDTHNEHQNGTIETDASGTLDDSHLIVEPDQGPDIKTDRDDHDDHEYSDDLTPKETQARLERIGEQSPEQAPGVHHDSGGPHDPETLTHREPHEDLEDKLQPVKVNPVAVGTDLEDIVNLLESGPTIQSFSGVGASIPSAGSEAGEIPDED